MVASELYKRKCLVIDRVSVFQTQALCKVVLGYGIEEFIPIL